MGWWFGVEGRRLRNKENTAECLALGMTGLIEG